MRAWNSSGGVLIDEGPSEVALVSTLFDELPPGPWQQRRRYALLDGQGRIRCRYYDSVWSVDDELGASLHAIVDGALRELTVTVHTSAAWTVRRRETVVVGDLREIPAGDTEAWAWIRRAIDAETAAQNRAADDRAREREARRASVEDALRDFGAGPEFRRAQEVLNERIERYGGDLETKLLKALGRFGGLRPSVPRAALDEFVRACRLAAFDATLKDRRAVASAAPAPASAELQALAATVDQLQKDLLEAAVGQEWADAPRNAADYRAAADHCARAAAALRPSG